MDPELADVLRAVAPHDFSDLAGERQALAERRRAAAEPAPVTPEGVVVDVLEVPGVGAAPSVAVRRHTPTGADGPVPCLVWMHGGGYIMGEAEQDDVLLGELAAEVGCVVLSVEYRLAPEHPFPAALDDAAAVLTWAFAGGPEVGIDPRQIAIGGGSAGGGLAAGLALWARDHSPVQPCFQLLVYPMLDDLNVDADTHEWRGLPVWTPADNHAAWSSYLRSHDPARPTPQYASAMRATDLRGLPPAAILVGDLDLFLSEDIWYAGRLAAADVSVSLEVYPGAFHGFNVAAPQSAVARRFNGRLHELLAAGLARAADRSTASHHEGVNT